MVLSHNVEDPLHITVVAVVFTCDFSPTIIEFTDTEGKEYTFYFRDGYAYIECDTTNTVLVKGDMLGRSSVCNWVDAIHWAARSGVIIEDRS